jgi:hypothetical protein
MLSRRKFLLSLALFYVFVSTLLGAWEHSVDLQAFGYGDWVIHYYNGFVRRGLTGQLILAIGGIRHAPLVIFLVKTGLYVFFFICAYNLFKPLLNDSLLFLCVVAPMSIPFTSIDSLAAGRKEILLLALLAALTVLLASRTGAYAPRVPLWICTAFSLVLILLSHEGMLFFCGFPLLVLFLHSAAKGRLFPALMAFAGTFACLALVFLLLIAFKGTPEIVGGMCQALSENPPVDCETISAISWLGVDSRAAVGEVLRMVSGGGLWVYVVAGLLSYLPIVVLVACSKAAKNWTPPRAIVILGLWAANLPTALIYGIATDWGRWLYIAVTSNIFVLAYCYRAQILESGLPFRAAAKTLEQLGQLGAIIRIAFQFVVVIFLLCWNAPPFNVRMGTGHVGHVERILAHLVKAKVDKN